MSDSERRGARWFKAEKGCAGQAVYDLATELTQSQAWRLSAAKGREEAYLGHEIRCLGVGRLGDVTDTGGYLNRNRYRIAQSVIEMAKASIASQQRPKAKFTTKGGNYAQRTRAKHLTRAAESPLYQSHGRWSDGWQIGEQAFRDCAIHEAGVVRVRGSVLEKRVCYERVHSWQLYVDEQDACNGDPQTLVCITRVDRSTLQEECPDKAYEIDMAPSTMSSLSQIDFYPSGSSDMVQVIEAWRLPVGKQKGRHVITLATGAEDGTLLDKEWEHDGFPFVTIVWEPAEGYWGTPMIDQIMDPQVDANEIYGSMLENANKLGNGYVLEPYGSEVTGLTSNEVGRIINYKGNIPPTIVHPQPFGPALAQFAGMLRGMCFELAGISEQSAQSRKQPGIDSGAAIRETNDLGAVRQLPKSRAYEAFYVDLAKLTVRAMADLDETLKSMGEGGLRVIHTGDKFLEEIDWESVEMAEDDFTTTLQVTSSFPDTIAGRIQTVEELKAQGVLSNPAYLKLKAQGVPDLPAHDRRLQAQERLMERTISEMESAEEDTPQDEFQQPDPIMNLTLAIGQMGEAYLEALADQAPEHVKELMRMWIVEADQLLNPPQTPAPAGPPPGPTGDPSLSPEGMPMGPGPEMMGGPPPDMIGPPGMGGPSPMV